MKMSCTVNSVNINVHFNSAKYIILCKLPVYTFSDISGGMRMNLKYIQHNGSGTLHSIIPACILCNSGKEAVIYLDTM